MMEEAGDTSPIRAPPADTITKLEPTVRAFAQFISVCSAYILAETLCISSSFLSSSRAKRRASERRTPLFIDSLQPSTNSDKLSDLCYTRHTAQFGEHTVRQAVAGSAGLRGGGRQD